MRRAFFTFLIAFVCHAGGQPGDVSGRVFDPARAVIAGAEVTVGNSTVTTKADGWFSVVELAPGEYRMRVSAKGFSTRTAL